MKASLVSLSALPLLALALTACSSAERVVVEDDAGCASLVDGATSGEDAGSPGTRLDATADAPVTGDDAAPSDGGAPAEAAANLDAGGLGDAATPFPDAGALCVSGANQLLSSATSPMGMAVGSGVVAVSERAGDQMLVVPLDGGAPSTYSVGPATGGTLEPSPVALSGSTVYWPMVASTILSGPITAGARPSQIANDSFVYMGLAADSASVYWSDSEIVYQAGLLAGAPTVFATEAMPVVGLVTDATNLYETTYRSIIARPKSGAPPTTIYTGGTTITMMAVDDSYVYFADAPFTPKTAGLTIGRVPIGGGPSTIIASGQTNSALWSYSAIAVDDTYVYWPSVVGGATQLLRALKTGTGAPSSIATTDADAGTIDTIVGIAVDDAAVYYATETAVFRLCK